jgi:hypothetical protein
VLKLNAVRPPGAIAGTPNDRRGEACELLAPIYGWFTDGFDLADIRGENAPLRTGMSSRALRSDLVKITEG